MPEELHRSTYTLPMQGERKDQSGQPGVNSLPCPRLDLEVFVQIQIRVQIPSESLLVATRTLISYIP